MGCPMGHILLICIIIVVLALFIYHYFQLTSTPEQQPAYTPSLDFQAPRFISDVLAQILLEQQVLFDEVARLFMQQCIEQRDSRAVFAMRDDLLSKLPEDTQHEVRRLDLDEWSIYLTFGSQSYEYYIGRYGVFQLHVDRFGEEHKLSLWKPEFHPEYSHQHMDESLQLPMAHL